MIQFFTNRVCQQVYTQKEIEMKPRIYLNKLLITLIVDARHFYAKSVKRWSRGNETIKTLFITEDNRISKSQIFPFYFYKKEFRQRWDVEFREVNFDLLEPNRSLVQLADIIFFQPWFIRGEERIVEVLLKIREVNSSAKVIFLDAYAPLDLRYAKDVESLINVYVKKQFFSDYSEYAKATYGDTNLVEYYNRLFNIPDLEKVQFNVPTEFINKLHLGPGFFTSRKMLPTFTLSDKPVFSEKTIDVHARLAVKGSDWYQAMREHALLMCNKVKTNSIISSELVSFRQYWKELEAARICFSPFGYGEVCWRDYEAIMSGALLIKPDMSHIKMEPNIFIPFVTYIPISWDFSDLPEKIEYYLRNKEEREEITKAAYSVLHNYFQEKDFINQFSSVFSQN
jgi:hypothetical protein